MRDVLASAGAPALRVAALGWLLVAAPLELASALAGLVSRPSGELGVVAYALVGARVLVVALGLVLGRQIAQRTTGLRPFAWRWAAADLGTLALALASSALPSSRLPGESPVVWAAYAAAAIVVVAATD
jgi:hypothetical protein